MKIHYDAKNNIRTDRFPSVYHVMKIYGQMMRPNALYRELIWKRIRQFRVESKEHYSLETLEVGTSCTSIHIRRGDRMYAGVDMNEYCKNFTRNSNQTCTDREGKAHPCIDLSDKGCFSIRPYGGVSLQEYLDRAIALHNTRTFFIMTDDAEWLYSERKKIDPSIKIYSISAQGSDHRLHAHQNATIHGVEFHASLRMVQQCQALVGHWGSAGL